MAVKPIPKGFHSLTPALTVSNAKAAIEFYKKAFGAVEHYRFQMPDGKIMHAELQIGDSKFMLGEKCEKEGAATGASQAATGMLYLYVDDVDAVVARALKAGGCIKMPVSDMFWGDRFGQVVDPFGHVWGVGTHKEDLTPEQIRERAKKAVPQMAHST